MTSSRKKPLTWMQTMYMTFPPGLGAELRQRYLAAGLCAHGFEYEADCPTCKHTPNVAQEFALAKDR
jgi:hypothetical protein